MHHKCDYYYKFTKTFLVAFQFHWFMCIILLAGLIITWAYYFVFLANERVRLLPLWRSVSWWWWPGLQEFRHQTDWQQQQICPEIWPCVHRPKHRTATTHTTMHTQWRTMTLWALKLAGPFFTASPKYAKQLQFYTDYRRGILTLKEYLQRSAWSCSVISICANVLVTISDCVGRVMKPQKPIMKAQNKKQWKRKLKVNKSASKVVKAQHVHAIRYRSLVVRANAYGATR